MKEFNDKTNKKKDLKNVTTFTVPFILNESKQAINISFKQSKEDIINEAFSYHAQGNISKAIKSYENFINQGFKDPRVLANYGSILSDLGKFEEAEKLNRKAIKLDPEFVNAHYNLGIILKGLNKFIEAEISTRKAIKLNPNFAEAYFSLGNILIDLGKLKEAEISLRKAIDLNPDLSLAYFNLGNTLNKLGNLEEAELLLRRAIELNPNSVEAYANLGNILSKVGNLKEAELLLRKAIELNPNSAESHSNLGNILSEVGNLKEAELLLRKAIQLNPKFAVGYSNLGNILREIGNVKEAEVLLQKAIEINPYLAEAYSNLGDILIIYGQLKDAEVLLQKAIRLKPKLPSSHAKLGSLLISLGKLKEAEISLLKAIELDPAFSKAYFSISNLKYKTNNRIWNARLFSKEIIKNKTSKEKIDIFFARANILHNQKKYKLSADYLKLANDLKLKINPSNSDLLIHKSKTLFAESNKEVNPHKDTKKFPESIFIVGMLRSGSTLLESILSMNSNVIDLGEIDFLEQSFLEWNKFRNNNPQISISELYWKKIKNFKNKFNITTNKNLYNYLYAGIIASHIPNSKIIYCFRHPLDNILSIHRAHFARGNEYASSLIDCAKVYLEHDEVMKKYIKKYRSVIYELDYDLLVTNPNQEIKSLISWLNWDWNDSYLSPHLNPRSVSTASNVQVRSPINSKSIGGWKNYKDMLKPAIEILTQTDKYQDIIS